MNTNPVGEGRDDVLVELIRRHEVFEALADDALEKPELASVLDISPATAHRILTSFREKGYIRRTGRGYELTPLGARLREVTERFRSETDQTYRLEALYETVIEADIDVDVEYFDGATVTVAKSGDPYRPINRFAHLLAETETLRGFDTTSVSPSYVEDIHERIVDGMPIEIVFETAVIDRLSTEYADLADVAFERENLTLFAHDEIPFGLALFDDRVGIGVYDSELGILSVFIDTDNEDAYAWGERLFDQYRAAADRVV